MSRSHFQFRLRIFKKKIIQNLKRTIYIIITDNENIIINYKH